MNDLERTRTLLEIPFRFDLVLKLEGKLVAQETRQRLQGVVKKVNEILVRFNGEGRAPGAMDRKIVYEHFLLVAVEGRESLRRAFASARERKHLAWALDFNDGGKCEPIMMGKHFPEALRLFEENLSRRIFRILFFFLVREWYGMHPGPRSLLQKSLESQLKVLSGKTPRKNGIIHGVNRFRTLFFAGDGPMELGRRLLDTTREVLTEFLSRDREPDWGSSGDMPMFLTVKNAPAYLCGGLFSLFEMSGRLGRVPEFLPLVLPSLRHFAGGVGLKRLLVLLILWVHANTAVGAAWKEELKSIATSAIGDPQERGAWSEWPGITLGEKNDLERVREILNIWIGEHLIGFFFEKLIRNEERRDFWLPYAKKVSVRIFCGPAERRDVLRDAGKVQENLKGGEVRETFGKTGAEGNIRALMNRVGTLNNNGQGAALVMEYGEHLLVEFSQAGNAFYIYNRRNLTRHGLEKFRLVLDGKSDEPLMIGDLKKPSLPQFSRTHNWFAGEGRFIHHSGTRRWQEVLQTWLKERIHLVP
jgi:hypothetical protein